MRLIPLAVGLTLVVALSAQERLWLAPAAGDARPNAVATALAHLDDDKPALALPALRRSASLPVVGRYVRLHQGRAELADTQLDNAAASAAAVLATKPEGYLLETALWLAADAAEARLAWADATKALSALTTHPLVAASMANALHRLGLAAQQAGQPDLAVKAFTRVHDEFSASAEASDSTKALLSLAPSFQAATAERLTVAMSRAHQLYAARQFPDARLAYEGVRPLVGKIDRDLVDLRLAQCDARVKRYPEALAALEAYIGAGGANRDEAEYFRLGVLRDMGRHPEYLRDVRTFVDSGRNPVFVESALNDLGTHFILTDDDAQAAAVFTESYDRFPTGAFAGRAAWKAGWWAFSSGKYAETVRLFESAAQGLRRADYRSGWVYWAARAHERLGQRDRALAGYQQTMADYGNSYYGREAARVVGQMLAASRPASAGTVTPVRRGARVNFSPGAPPSNVPLIQALLTSQLYADAAGELQRVQRVEGNSPVIEATLAYALNRGGQLRPGISAMKRAYPQYLAEGGEALPRELLTVLFPVAYWDLIQKHAALHTLDPFLVAALVAQESTFDPEIRSSADAWGLMQILPSTGRQYARSQNIRPFNTASLTTPEINVRIGTTYLADLIRRFGSVAPALASYNAGESRVSRWLAERPGVDRDEFIDGIPFPETQGYVKKILGTAEDYRVLYRRTPAGPARR